MPGTTVFSNSEISHALLGVLKGHRHLRLALTTNDGETIVLQEAAVAAIVRAYTTIKTHPFRRAVRMISTPLSDRKKGYAEHQLVETDTPDDEVEAELTRMLGE